MASRRITRALESIVVVIALCAVSCAQDLRQIEQDQGKQAVRALLDKYGAGGQGQGQDRTSGAASTPKVGSSNSADPGPVRIPLASWGPRTYNPAYASFPEDRFLLKLMQTSLSQCTVSSSLSKDGLVLSLTLAANLTWSDGTPLVASDWADAATQYYENAEAESPLSKTLSPDGESPLKWEATGDLGLRITSPVPLKAEDFTKMVDIPPLPMRLVAAWRKLGVPGSLGTGLHAPADFRQFMLIDTPAASLACSGKWQLESYELGKDLVLAPRPGTGLPKIVMVFCADAAGAKALFEQGGVDLLSITGPKWIPSGDASVLDVAESPLVLGLVLNPTRVKAPVRDTVFSAIDRPAFSAKEFGGFAEPAYGLWGRYESSSAATQMGQREGSDAKDTAFRIFYAAENPDRKAMADSLSSSAKAKGFVFAPQEQAFDFMAAALVMNGDWDSMLFLVNENVSDPVMALHVGKRDYFQWVPITRMLTTIWAKKPAASQNFPALSDQMAVKALLAYGNALY